MPYRDARSALESRRDDLRRELDELRPQAEALREVARAQEAVERELAATEARLAQMDTPDPLLEDLRIASPCNARWDAMKGDNHVRFCAECEKNVYDLSSLTREAANRLLAGAGDDLCVRLYRRADGTVLTADCPVGLRRKQVRRAVYGTVGAGALLAAGTMAAGMVTMGKRVAPARAGKVAEVPESYVPQPLSPDPDRGVVFVYHQEAQPQRAGMDLELWADGRAVRIMDGGIHMPLSASDQATVREIPHARRPAPA